jgi:Domain of unknown function (DUF4114)
MKAWNLCESQRDASGRLAFPIGVAAITNTQTNEERRCRRFACVLPTLIAAVTMVFAPTSGNLLADPTLPLPDVPICGDQDGSESPLILNCVDFVPLTDIQAFQVPGTGLVNLKFDFVFREAAFGNELGVFKVDDAAGSINGLQPGDPNYLAAAFSRATIIFPSGSDAFTPDVTLAFGGGDIVVFFMIQNSTLEDLLASNPNNQPDKGPLAFFSMDLLNPDGVDHLVAFENTIDKFTQLAFEDLTGGGDLDYNDVVYDIVPALTPLPMRVAIDIKPGSSPNSINPASKGVIPVAILTTPTFDATTVDAKTVKFGPTGTEAAAVHSAREDVDGDGNTDLILHFRTQDTGILCGTTSAHLTGKTFDGQQIEGSDSIRTVGCK